MATTTATHTAPRTGLAGREVNLDLRTRALKLMQTEIDFIPNPEFRAEDGGAAPFVDATLRYLDEARNAPADLPSHLRRMCESELLTQEQEVALFREMNFVKYRANALRSRIDPDATSAEMIAEIDQLLRRAEDIRDHIIQANMRLVMSIVKKFVSPQQSFDDMLSDGIFTLMQAVEKFEIGRAHV